MIFSGIFLISWAWLGDAGKHLIVGDQYIIFRTKGKVREAFMVFVEGFHIVQIAL